MLANLIEVPEGLAGRCSGYPSITVDLGLVQLPDVERPTLPVTLSVDMLESDKAISRRARACR
jgi:hypothetical protein